jgi:sugar lactone lactonase YvrE
MDSQQRLIITDSCNHRIRRIENDGTLSTIAGGAMTEQLTANSTAIGLALYYPRGIAVDQYDNLFIADTSHHRVIRTSAIGDRVTILAGNGSAGASGDFGPATDSNLSFPCAVAVDATGQVYIADTYNYRIRKIDNNGIITTVVGLIESATSGPAATAHLSNPLALAATPLGTLFAGGVSGTIERLLTDAAGPQVQTVAGRYPQQRATGDLAAFRTNDFGIVGGIAYDTASSRIFVTEASAQSNRIHAITASDPSDSHSWTIDVLANTDGLPGFADGPAADAKFRAPSGIFYDAVSRTLYIADTGNHAIRALSLSSMTITTLVNRRHSFGFGGDGAAADNALLDNPTAVTRCSNGDIFIADTGNHRIRRVAAATGLISTVLGDGADASSGEGAPSTTYPVDTPRGLVCDSIGNVFITSSTTVRMLAANDAGIVDGTGAVQTIYGQAPRQSFPASSTACLSGITLTAPGTLQIVDACAGLLVELRQQAR